VFFVKSYAERSSSSALTLGVSTLRSCCFRPRTVFDTSLLVAHQGRQPDVWREPVWTLMGICHFPLPAAAGVSVLTTYPTSGTGRWLVRLVCAWCGAVLDLWVLPGEGYPSSLKAAVLNGEFGSHSLQVFNSFDGASFSFSDHSDWTRASSIGTLPCKVTLVCRGILLQQKQ